MGAQSRLQVMVLEDDPALGRAVARYLGARGAEAHLFGTCRGALAADRSFDVAVLDIELPDGDGVEVAAELLDRGQVGVVLFFSGMEDRNTINRAEPLGPFVGKSEGASALYDRIGVALTEFAAEAVGSEETATPTAKGGVARSGLRRRVPR